MTLLTDKRHCTPPEVSFPAELLQTMGITDTDLLHHSCTEEEGPCSKSVKEHKIEKVCFVDKKYLSYTLGQLLSSNYDYMALFINGKVLKPFPIPDFGPECPKRKSI